MTLSRRHWIQTAVAGGAVASVAPRMVFGQAASGDSKLRIAAIGIGGKGKSDMASLASHPKFKLTAACDVDKKFYKNADEFGQNVAKYQDYRELFKQSAEDFDAVVIATPDHMHAPIALMAMEHDKHVYLQKPLAQDIGECRTLAEAAAKKPGLATQMGIQIHGHPAYRTAVKWIQEGIIGSVHEVHSWSGKGWGGEMKPKAPVDPPESLDWNLYCGVSERRDFVDGWYHRGSWRKWFAFGTGTQGDMGCHIVDPVFSALALKEPTVVTSLGPKPFEENFALISKVVYSFVGTRYTTKKLDMTWYNGSLRPTKLAGLPESAELPHQGSVFIGAHGTLILPHIGDPIVYQTDGKPKENLPDRVEAKNHYHEWIDVALGDQEKIGAPFGYSGPLTETVLMGTVINHWPELAFQWNSTNCKFVGDTEPVKLANQLLRPEYRTGW